MLRRWTEMPKRSRTSSTSSAAVSSGCSRFAACNASTTSSLSLWGRRGPGRSGSNPGSPLAAEPSRRLGHVPAHIVHALADQFAQVWRVQHRADALACNVVHGQHSFRSVIVDQVHIHGCAVLEAERHAPVARDADTPLARTVALQGMQPEARRVGAARMRRLLQAEQDAPEPWRQTGRQQPCGFIPLVQRPQPLVPGSAPRYAPQESAGPL